MTTKLGTLTLCLCRLAVFLLAVGVLTASPAAAAGVCVGGSYDTRAKQACTSNADCPSIAGGGAGVCLANPNDAANATCVADTSQVDDVPGQKDLTQFCLVAGNGNPYEIHISWNMDDTQWSGGNTGDACALFDTNDSDQNANFALCVTVVGGPPAVIQPGSLKLYSCNNTRRDNCPGATLMTATNTKCYVNKYGDQATGEDGDPFSHSGSNKCKKDTGTGNCLTVDTNITCFIDDADFGGANVTLTDVCSYPSQSPSSNASDCVLTPTSTNPCTGVSCDDSNVCTLDFCEVDLNGLPQCVHLPIAGAQCRDAAPGVCDVAEVCDGVSSTCPVDGFAPATKLCTGTSQGGQCDDDAKDHCSGTSNTCVDAFKSSSTVCRAATGQCDVAETCTGTAGACPADAVAPVTTSCTGASNGGACDGADHCSGTDKACVDVFFPATSVCRAAAGQCDVAETCTGTSGACPADAVASAATPCTGTSNGGACDGADHCSGTSKACVDVFFPATTVCRAAAGQCDVAETCTGTSGACPADAVASAATPCTGTSNSGACDGTDHCSGTSKVCVDVFLPATKVCRAAASVCDVVENCTGTSGACPNDAFEPSTKLCTTDDNACTADHCNGSGTCVQGPPIAVTGPGSSCTTDAQCATLCGSLCVCAATSPGPSAEGVCVVKKAQLP